MEIFSSINVWQTDVAAELSVTDKGDGGSSPKLRGLDTNPHGDYGPRIRHAFRDTIPHLYTLSLPGPSQNASPSPPALMRRLARS